MEEESNHQLPSATPALQMSGISGGRLSLGRERHHQGTGNRANTRALRWGIQRGGGEELDGRVGVAVERGRDNGEQQSSVYLRIDALLVLKPPEPEPEPEPGPGPGPGPGPWT